MTENQVQVAMACFAKNVPQKMLTRLCGHLERANENAMDGLMNIRTKSFTAAVLLAIFLGNFGAGRFYIGDEGLGLCRLLTSIAIAIAGIFLPLTVAALVVSAILSAANFVWHITDIFLVAGKVKWSNYDKLSKYLIENLKYIQK